MGQQGVQLDMDPAATRQIYMTGWHFQWGAGFSPKGKAARRVPLTELPDLQGCLFKETGGLFQGLLQLLTGHPAAVGQGQ